MWLSFSESNKWLLYQTLTNQSIFRIMKYHNIAFVALFSLCMVSCGGDKSKTTHVEDTESMEMDDEDENIEDETEYLEAAMTALESGETELAITEIMNAITSIKSDLDKMDNPSMANAAISELTKIVTSMKSGTVTTVDELQKAIMSIELFSEDDMDIDEELIEEEIEE